MRVGFPIRKSSDQSLFAAPQGLSQRTTSFIASQHQGIHRIPLRHLIALIVDAHPIFRSYGPDAFQLLGKTSYILEFRSTEPSSHDDEPTAGSLLQRSNEPSLHDVDEHVEKTRYGQSRRNGYGRAIPGVTHLVEPDGIEPTTSCLQSTRSPN